MFPKEIDNLQEAFQQIGSDARDASLPPELNNDAAKVIVSAIAKNIFSYASSAVITLRDAGLLDFEGLDVQPDQDDEHAVRVLATIVESSARMVAEVVKNGTAVFIADQFGAKDDSNDGSEASEAGDGDVGGGTETAGQEQAH
jgi:hypothetical protein